MSVINKEIVDIMNEPLFLGSDLGIARYDIQKHRIFEQLTEKQLSFFWRPEEVDLTTDSAQFAKLSEFEQNIFTKNLKYQILMDTLQGSAPTKTFGELISDGSLDTWVQTWTFSETIHSRSYTHIIRNIFPDPSKIFEEVVKDKDIMARAASIGKYYDDVADQAMVYKAEIKEHGVASEKTIKDTLRAIYLCLHSVNALEAIRFYVSFACSFNFYQHHNVLEGNAKIIRLIARDEQLHHKGTQYMIKCFQNGSEGELAKQVAEECHDEAQRIFMETVDQEFDWAKTIFKDGQLIDLGVDELTGYIMYLAPTRMRQCGLQVPEEYKDAPKTNPIPWIRDFLSSSDIQVAPQEVEISSYLISQITNDLTDDEMSKYKRYL